MAKTKRKESSLLSSFRRTARLYAKSRIGVIGLTIIAFFVVLAVFAPWLAPNNPVLGFNVAAPYAVPSWATFFPQYSHLSVDYYPVPATSFATSSGLSAWSISGSDYSLLTSNKASPRLLQVLANDSTTGPQTFIYVNATVQTNDSISYAYRPIPTLPYGEVFFSMTTPFYFNGNAPPDFQINTQVFPLSMRNVSAIYAVFEVQTPRNTSYTLASVEGFDLSSVIDLRPSSLGQWNQVNVTDSMLGDLTNGIPGLSNASVDAASIIFNGAGTYNLTFQLQGACSDNPTNQLGYSPCGSQPSLSALVSPVSLHFSGGAYGLLGSDNEGRDVWSQFVWGSQVSLLIGILSALGAVGIGALTGITGGYLGGISDEIIGRITDFVLVLPGLPLLIILVFIITENPLLRASIYVWVIVIFVVTSWPFIGRIIRSQVLSVKERAFVEASRAVGGGTGHILRRHILPNVMGLVYSQMALNVSGFILTEAALDYLAISIHPVTVMTWGIMLTQSLGDATSNSLHGYVWWWFLPPGIAIAALSLSFVLVGYALDSIFNPRLRAR